MDGPNGWVLAACAVGGYSPAPEATVSVVNIPPSSGSSSLFQTIFRNADTNRDNQLSTDEFRTALESFLTDLRAAVGRSDSGTISLSSVAGGTGPAGSTDGLPYAAIPGFVLEKLQDESHVSDKYSASVRLFSKALAATGASPTAAGLQQVADWLNAHGATAVIDKDRLSINGDDPVDVITNIGGTDSTWWFHNIL